MLEVTDKNAEVTKTKFLRMTNDAYICPQCPITTFAIGRVLSTASCSPGLIGKRLVAWHPPWRTDTAPTFPPADPAWSDLWGMLESDPSI